MRENGIQFRVKSLAALEDILQIVPHIFRAGGYRSDQARELCIVQRLRRLIEHLTRGHVSVRFGAGNRAASQSDHEDRGNQQSDGEDEQRRDQSELRSESKRFHFAGTSNVSVLYPTTTSR